LLNVLVKRVTNRAQRFIVCPFPWKEAWGTSVRRNNPHPGGWKAKWSAEKL